MTDQKGSDNKVLGQAPELATTAASCAIGEVKRFEEALPAIAEHTVEALGADFFDSLVRRLAAALEVRCAFVTEGPAGDKSRVRSLAFWMDGKVRENLEYDTDGGAWREIMEGRARHFPRGFHSLFSKDSELVKLEPEGFLGAPAFDSSGKVIGHVAVMDDKSMGKDPRAVAILKIFAARAGAELDRRRTERRLSETLAQLEQLKNHLNAENAYLQEEIRLEHNFGEIVGSSPALRKVLASVEQVAPMDSTVLILGEPGTGKEMVARAIHRASRRRRSALVKLNCTAISAGLVESELFGHVKGAFTGALDRHAGRFEVADGGTLFLDEVGELPLDTQVKLLRVLQEHEFEPVGSNKTIRVDVRIIAATNRMLEEAVLEGGFRSDLFYRLNVFPVSLPPLRERRSDIPQLVMLFLERFRHKTGKIIDSVHKDTMELLMEYAWPGNIRELQNVIERAVILTRGPVLRLDPALIPKSIAIRQLAATVPAAATTRCAGPASHGTRTDPAPPADTPAPTLDELTRNHIVAVLKSCGGVIEGPKGAARSLGLRPSTLRSRIAKLGVDLKSCRG